MHKACIGLLFAVHHCTTFLMQTNQTKLTFLPKNAYFRLYNSKVSFSLSVSILLSPQDSSILSLSVPPTGSPNRLDATYLWKNSLSLPCLQERNRWGLEGMKEIRDERISPKMGTERVRQRERERERGGRGTGKPIGMENQVIGSKDKARVSAESRGQRRWWIRCGMNKNMVDSWRTSYHEILSVGSNSHFGVIWAFKAIITFHRC